MTAAHPNADPNYRSIGDKSLINFRKNINAPPPLSGTFADYVPFYLGHHSPMLLQIKTGFEGIEQLPQSDIIYLVADHDDIVAKGLDYFFTDGHARYKFTQFFSNPADFDQLDWETIYAPFWQNTQEDEDRQRCKQAEYMVRNEVTIDCIKFILVFDKTAQQNVVNLQQQLKNTIPVKISTKAYY